MAIDPFENNSPAPGHATDIVAVTPDDGGLAIALQELRVGTAPSGGGTLRVASKSGGDVVLLNVQAGERVSGPFHVVYATGTTVGDIVGWM